jgi:transposase
LERQRAEAIRKNKGDSMCEMVRNLMDLRALGPASAWLFVHEVFGWRQIKNRRQLASLIGLTPTPYDSGQTQRDQGISKAGNRRVRAMAIEIAWIWLRYQPESQLSRWYQKRFGAGSKRQRRIGIVALARKLMIAIWKYLNGGEIPDGAELREGNYVFAYTPSLS